MCIVHNTHCEMCTKRVEKFTKSTQKSRKNACLLRIYPLQYTHIGDIKNKVERRLMKKFLEKEMSL